MSQALCFERKMKINFSKRKASLALCSEDYFCHLSQRERADSLIKSLFYCAQNTASHPPLSEMELKGFYHWRREGEQLRILPHCKCSRESCMHYTVTYRTDILLFEEQFKHKC